MFSTDTETTGIDIHHGAKPFIVSFGLEDDSVESYVWDVDPLTREPKYNSKDWKAIRRKLASKEPNIYQNAKFDTEVLTLCDPERKLKVNWDYTHDIMLSAHLLHSLRPRDLTTISADYLDVDILHLEEALIKATNSARSIARHKYPEWQIAKAGLECMPSSKGESGLNKFDMWLPRAVAKAENYPQKHPWWDIALLYNRADCLVTLHTHKKHMEMIRNRKLQAVYTERRKLLEVVYHMETTGITYNESRRKELYVQYRKEADYNSKVCLNLSGGNLTEMPKGGSSNALRTTLFDHFNLKSNKQSKKTGNDKADKDVLSYWLSTLSPKSKAHAFIRNLAEYRQRSTAMSYMDSYDRFSVVTKHGRLWRRLHPSLNLVGTDTLRGSSNNPNQQNISKKPGFNLRYLFGPAPGREWWALDYENIELRIPAYEADETEMVNLFEHPDDPPYFGSNHLLICHILYPREFDQCLKDGVSFKDRYKATYYQWTKNGNFAVQYGAIEESGTADRAYHMKGAQRKIKSRFKKISALNDYWIEFAQQRGYVLTVKDNDIGGTYPIECERNNRGQIRPTVPLNYHVQSTAMWCMNKAMVRCYNHLKNHPGYCIIMQVHDELVFDFPYKPKQGNAPLVRQLRGFMSQSGDDIGIPLRVSVAYHKDNYSVEEKLAL